METCLRCGKPTAEGTPACPECIKELGGPEELSKPPEIPSLKPQLKAFNEMFQMRRDVKCPHCQSQLIEPNSIEKKTWLCIQCRKVFKHDQERTSPNPEG